jgi:muramoyltetrapeptide carboxypeptidase
MPGRPVLKKGDSVGIFLPSSPVREPFRGKGLAALKRMGYAPVEVPDVLSRANCEFLAREPRQTIEDMRRFFQDSEIKALWAGRGGYGSNLLLPLLQDLEIPAPKIIIGSSDVSYLLWYLLDRFDAAVFYGPMVYSSLADNRFNEANLTQILSGDYDEIKMPGGVLIPGTAKGPVTGGCLSNFLSLTGTPYLPEVTGRVLLLEDVGERPYRLDRMFWQLANIEGGGILSSIRGLVLGRFPGCFNHPNEKDIFLQRVRRYLLPYNIPVIYDLPFGHGEDLHTLPLGQTAAIDTEGAGYKLSIQREV